LLPAIQLGNDASCVALNRFGNAMSMHTATAHQIRIVFHREK
jgi:hypothetical protein